MKQRIIALITFLSGIYFILEFILPASITESAGITAEINESLSNGFLTVSAMAFGLGIISLVLSQISKIAFLKKDWFFSMTMLAGLLVMLTVTSADFIHGEQNARNISSLEMLSSFCTVIIKNTDEKSDLNHSPHEQSLLLAKALEQKQFEISELQDPQLSTLISHLKNDSNQEEHRATLLSIKEFLDASLPMISQRLLKEKDKSYMSQVFNFLNQGVFVPLGAAMFSLLGFYIASAAFSAFRVRSFESSLMMIAAILVIAGQTSFTLRLWDGFSPIRDWLLQVPNSAAFRGITIGAGLAGLVLSIRILLSLESKSFRE